MTEIRTASPDDAAAVRAIYAPYVEETPTSFEIEVPTADEMARRIAATLATHPWLVAAREGRIIGYAYAGQHRSRAGYRWSTDVSIYIAQDMRRSGLGRALYAALLPELEALGYANAFAGITLPNAASVGLHEALGFTPVGVYRRVAHKLGTWHDVGWWQRALGRPDGAEAPHCYRDPKDGANRAATRP